MVVRNTSEAVIRAGMAATPFPSHWGSLGPPPFGNNDNSSASSTPFVSAPSSPRNSCSMSSGFYLSSAFADRGREAFEGGQLGVIGGAIISSKEDATKVGTKNERAPSIVGTNDSEEFQAFSATGSDFDFSARFSEADGSIWSPAPMSSADELFYNGKIRPLQLFSPVQQDSGMAKPTASRIDDGFFDFRSSANYTLPSPRTPAVPPKHAQRKQGFALPKPASQVGPSTVVQWQKMGKGTEHRVSIDDPMGRKNPTRERSSVASERTRRAREGGHRRARSLSPLRVFNVDDQPRPSFESESVYASGLGPDISKSDFKATEQGQKRLTKGRTLKELLHGGDCRAVTAKGNKLGKKGGGKSVAKGDAKRTLQIATPAPSCPVSRRSNCGGSKQTLSPHELHYTSQRAQAEQMRKRTFLPYKQGLLGCLGFSSKSYRSFAGIHTMNPS